MSVVRSDEELEADLARILADPSVSASEKLRIHDEHDAMMVARKAERAAMQAHYDSGKGKSAKRMFREPLASTDKGRGTD